MNRNSGIIFQGNWSHKNDKANTDLIEEVLAVVVGQFLRPDDTMPVGSAMTESVLVSWRGHIQISLHQLLLCQLKSPNHNSKNSVKSTMAKEARARHDGALRQEVVHRDNNGTSNNKNSPERGRPHGTARRTAAR